MVVISMRMLVGSLLLLALAFMPLAAQDTAADKVFFDQILSAMRLAEGSVVADIGTGSVPTNPDRIAKIVGPSGKVICVDIDQKALDKLTAALKAEGATNIEVQLGKPDDPLLPEKSCDAVLISNAYHEMEKHEAMLGHIRQALKPGGRLVIVERIRDSLRNAARSEQTSKHQLGLDVLDSELQAAGFQVISGKDLGIMQMDVKYMHKYLIAATPKNGPR
jgi:precorrin-6B methylase 2